MYSPVSSRGLVCVLFRTPFCLGSRFPPGYVLYTHLGVSCSFFFMNIFALLIHQKIYFFKVATPRTL